MDWVYGLRVQIRFEISQYGCYVSYLYLLLFHIFYKYPYPICFLLITTNNFPFFCPHRTIDLTSANHQNLNQIHKNQTTVQDLLYIVFYYYCQSIYLYIIYVRRVISNLTPDWTFNNFINYFSTIAFYWARFKPFF